MSVKVVSGWPRILVSEVPLRHLFLLPGAEHLWQRIAA